MDNERNNESKLSHPALEIQIFLRSSKLTLKQLTAISVSLRTLLGSSKVVVVETQVTSTENAEKRLFTIKESYESQD
jgi:hypothetical protein